MSEKNDLPVHTNSAGFQVKGDKVVERVEADTIGWELLVALEGLIRLMNEEEARVKSNIAKNGPKVEYDQRLYEISAAWEAINYAKGFPRDYASQLNS